MASKKRLKFVLVSRKTPDAFRIRDALELNPNYQVQWEETSQSAMKVILSGKIDCLIFNFEQLDVPQVKLCENIRDIGHDFQIFIFAEPVSTEAVLLAENLRSVVIFEKALLDFEKDIAGLCSRMVSNEVVKPRRAKRYTTNQKVIVENLVNGETTPGWIGNLSGTGAYVEIPSSTFKLGQQVRVIIPLAEVGKTHSVQGEIVWVKSSSAQRRSVGVRFLKPANLEKQSA